MASSLQATVSLLPVSLSLVHIPRPRLQSLTQYVLKQILQPTPTFLNVTSNELEFSLFADQAAVAELEALARREEHRSGRSLCRHQHAKRRHKEPVEVSADRWAVLQIDTHQDGADNSGARVHELSAPLARAGISILYQSSYMSDFIFVKEIRLQEVLTLLGSAGFDLYTSDHGGFSVSPPFSPADDSSTSSLRGSVHELNGESSVVLTRTNGCGSPLATRGRNSPTASRAQLRSAGIPSPAATAAGEHPDEVDTAEIAPARNTHDSSSPYAPTASEISILEPDLTCIGLVDEYAETWSTRIIKLVAFPELIPVPPSQIESHCTRRLSIGTKPRAADATVPANFGDADDSASDSSFSDDEDNYFSGSSQLGGSVRSTSSATSDSGALFVTPEDKTPDVPDGVEPDVPLSDGAPSRRREYAVPFFSFTRTAEGSSLTTSTSTLSALFPPHDRHMVIRSHELDASPPELGDEGEGDGDAEDDMRGPLKCLQIDLRRFGLDKHGIVCRFSQVLEESGVNHMYSSTYKTANLLVDKKKAERAQSLLRTS